MAHKLLRYREHHRALEARFSTDIPFSPPSSSDPPTATPAPAPGNDPNGSGGGNQGGAGIVGPILQPTDSGRPDRPGGPKKPTPEPSLPLSTPGTTPTNTRPVPLPIPTQSSLDSSSTTSTSSATRSTSSLIVQTTPNTPLTPSTTPPVQADSTVFTTVPGATLASASSTIPSVTPSPTPSSSGLGTGPIIGLAAAGIAGVAVLGIAGIWLFKKYVSHKDEPAEEPSFTRHSWMRNSLALPDEPTDGIGGAAGAAGIGAGIGSQNSSNRPRPPTMIERHQANFNATRSPSPGQQQGQYYNGNMAGYGSGGYDSPYAAANVPAVPPVPAMRSVSPGQAFAGHDTNPQPYHNPMAHSPEPSYGPGSTLAGAPVSYFTRHNGASSPPASGSLPNPYNGETYGGYANMERGTSFTPLQAQTYNEISQQLERSPFADPAPSSGPVGYNTQQTYTSAAQPKRSGSKAKGSAVVRPETVYDEEDAYGGI